jgi:hypothetical protein
MIRIFSSEVDFHLFLQGQQSILIQGRNINLIRKGGKYIKKNNTLFLLNYTGNCYRIVENIKPLH